VARSRDCNRAAAASQWRPCVCAPAPPRRFVLPSRASVRWLVLGGARRTQRWARCSRSTSAGTASTVAVPAGPTLPSTTRSCPRSVPQHVLARAPVAFQPGKWCAGSRALSCAGVPRPARQGFPLQQCVSVCFWIGSRSRFASRFCLPHTSQAPTAGHHAQGHARRDIRSPALSGLDVGMHLNHLSVRRVNITLGAKEDRNLITGLHTVADVYCSSCQTILGWKYVNPLHSTSLHSVLFLRAAHAWARLELGSAFLPACVHSAGQWQRRQRNVFRDGRLCSHRSRRSRRARNTRRANAL